MYKVQIEKTADKSLCKIHPTYREKIKNRIYSLADDPFPPDCKKLKGIDKNLYRVRVNQYRIVYEISKETLVISILYIDHRKEVYENI